MLKQVQHDEDKGLPLAWKLTLSVDRVFLDRAGIGLDEGEAMLGVLAHQPLDEIAW
jgi:hypothetical protein